MSETCSQHGIPSLAPAIPGKTLDWASNDKQADLKCLSEYVLKRDATSITVDSACVATSGSWKSPYDGATWTAASDLDIDHMVPLKNAWIVSSP
jgi:hypothetical protein